MGSSFTTIASAFRGGLKPKAARAYIIPLDPFANDTFVDKDTRSFQYFPESISDSKASNYQTKVIPGLSHPLYQWTSSGGREISFQAVFTRDRSLTQEERKATGEATYDAKKDKKANDLNASTLGSNKDIRSVDIPSAVAWLRSYMYPEFSQAGDGRKSDTPDRPYPPRKLLLGLPGVRINWGQPQVCSCEMYAIMLGCGVNYSAFFADGTPRIARVDLTFAEIIQVQGKIHSHDGYHRRRVWRDGYQLRDKGLPTRGLKRG